MLSLLFMAPFDWLQDLNASFLSDETAFAWLSAPDAGILSDEGPFARASSTSMPTTVDPVARSCAGVAVHSGACSGGVQRLSLSPGRALTSLSTTTDRNRRHL